MVAIVAAAAFITIFCLFASKAAWSQNRYQARVTTGKEKAYRQLEDNIKAYDKLAASYRDFDSETTNVIGGNSQGSGDKDGKNSRIVLDALPSAYDFPALASSLEKILADKSLKVTNISGTDDQLNQQINESSPSPQAVTMPFSFSISEAKYASVAELFTTLEKSIRPLQVDTISLTGAESSMSVNLTGHTYYQPAKSLNIKKQIQK